MEGKYTTMSLLLPTEKRARLTGLSRVSLHGQEFLDLVFVLDEEPGMERRARLGPMDVQGELHPGEPMLVRFVMGVATGAKPAL